MITKTLIKNTNIDFLIEQKILEFFSDPDSGLSLRPDFLKKIKERSRNEGKYISHQKVLQKYGLS